MTTISTKPREPLEVVLERAVPGREHHPRHGAVLRDRLDEFSQPYLSCSL